MVEGVTFLHSTLEFCGLAENDTDFYSCVANNINGYNHSTFFVNVVDLSTFVCVCVYVCVCVCVSV